jgi:hypothetical protein
MPLFTRRNGRRVLAVTALAACVAAVPATVAAPWENAVTAGSLGHSLASTLGDTLPPTCSFERPGHWICDVGDPKTATLAVYRVRSSGRCWSGRRPGRGTPEMPRSVRGCVGMWDQLRLGQRL